MLRLVTLLFQQLAQVYYYRAIVGYCAAYFDEFLNLN